MLKRENVSGEGSDASRGWRARLGSPCCQCVLVIGAFQSEARKRCRVASPHTHSILMRGWWHGLGWAVQPLDGSLSVLRCPERVLVVGGILVFFLARALGYGLGMRCAQALGLNTKEFCSQDPCSFRLCYAISRCWVSLMASNEMVMLQGYSSSPKPSTCLSLLHFCPKMNTAKTATNPFYRQSN